MDKKLSALLKIVSLCGEVDGEQWVRLAAIWHHPTSLVGAATIDFTDSDTPTLFDLYVHENYRLNGIGTALLQEAMSWAERVDKSLYLHVRPGNPAYQLYLHKGFQPTGELKDDGSIWLVRCATGEEVPHD